MGKVKATAVVPTMEYVMFKKGKEAYKEVLSQLTADQKKIFRKRMHTREWLDLDDFMDFNKAIVEVCYKGKRSGYEELGAESAEYGINSFLKFFFKFGDVNFFLKKATSTFSSYYQPGKLVVTDSDKGYGFLKSEGVPDRDDIIMLRIKGFSGRIIELAGKKVIQLDVERTGPESFTLEARWG